MNTKLKRTMKKAVAAAMAAALLTGMAPNIPISNVVRAESVRED